jgi:hypothetical protein
MSAQPNAIDELPSASFSLTIRANSTLHSNADSFTLEVSILTVRRMMMKGESIEIPIGDALTNKITVPVSTFRDEAQAKQWADHAFRSFRVRSTAALLSEAALTLGDEANWALDDLKIESMDMQNVAQTHIRGTTKRLQERFNLQRPGRQSQWDRLELMEAMKVVLNLLPEQERTIANAAARLMESYPGKAPESSDALRKIMKRQGISWKGLKKELQASS